MIAIGFIAFAAAADGPVGPPAPTSDTNPTAAEILDMEPAFLAGIQSGLEQIYERRYDAALQHFAKMNETFPETGLGALAETVIWQARMLENFDNRHDKEYWAASKRARKELDRALSLPGNEGWEHLATAAIVGMESIHTLRRRRYISALSLAFTAMGHIESSRDAAPQLVDLKLADGMYLYWRSVVTERSSMLPDFGDRRKEGIDAMRDVERNGVFIRPLATLALAFSYLEDGQSAQAEAACARNRGLYPDSVINNLVSAMVLVKSKKYDEALALLDRVHEVDASNSYAHYWRGLTLLRKRELDGAQASFERFLGMPFREKYQEAAAYYRLGQVATQRKEYGTAAANYQKAIRVDGHKSAKRALDALKDRRKQGVIAW